ncbi:hypothetical protein ACWDYH_03865 [Nocardia goodfellowii]
MSGDRRNERLLQALSDSGLTTEQLADKLQVNPKTVERWITTGRVPYPTHRYGVEDALGKPAAELWPDLAAKPPRTRAQAQSNERLRRAIFDARLTFEQLGEKVEMSTKQVQRWITKGTVPYPVHRQAISVLVSVPESELWPEATAERAKRKPSTVPAAGTAVHSNPRIAELMSWVDSTAPVKERDIHPQQAPQRNYSSYSRSYGVERSR